MLVDVIMGGPGREAAVSRISGKAIAQGLRIMGHDVAVHDLADRLDPACLRQETVVFNIVHGTYGEDGTLQALLDQHRRAYVGPDAAASRLCMDKEATKQRLRLAGLPVPCGLVVPDGSEPDPRHPDLPAGGLVIKPRFEGSSVGLRLLDGPQGLVEACREAHREAGGGDLLIEERLAGPEYTVAIIDLASGRPAALPPIHIVPAAGSYDYHAKYLAEDTRYLIVREPDLANRLSELALAAYRACGCRDLTRIDLMAAADGSLRILELNTLPGFTSHSLVPKAAAARQIDFGPLVDHLVGLAAARLPTSQPTTPVALRA